MNIALIVPTYGHFDYALKTVNSFFEHTPGKDHKCLVIDDASPDWGSVDWSKWPARVMCETELPRQELTSRTSKALDPNATGSERVLCYHFASHHGLTRSWNQGLRIAARNPDWRADVTICGNSDILFTPNWYTPILNALDYYELVGPLTNASGRVLTQNVLQYLPGYQLTDDPDYLGEVSRKLNERYPGRLLRTARVNGFFMVARTDVWWRGAYDSEHVINPAEKMDNGAYELQTRWRRKCWKIGLVPGSFIFHYRSISRGMRGVRGTFGRGAWRPRKEK